MSKKGVYKLLSLSKSGPRFINGVRLIDSTPASEKYIRRHKFFKKLKYQNSLDIIMNIHHKNIEMTQHYRKVYNGLTKKIVFLKEAKRLAKCIEYKCVSCEEETIYPNIYNTDPENLTCKRCFEAFYDKKDYNIKSYIKKSEKFREDVKNHIEEKRARISRHLKKSIKKNPS